MGKQSIWKRILSAVMGMAIMVSMTACGTSNDTAQQGGDASNGKKIINMGVTYSPGTINPLSPVTEVATYATGLMFLPLMEIGSDMQFHPMLAESVTTEDNKTFTIKLYENAKWSDGEPITVDDVMFTIRRIADAKVGSIYAYMYASFEGFDENGYLPEGTTDVAGLVKVDDSTLQMVAKEPMSLNIFNNAVSRCLWTIPEHVLKDVAPEELVASEFFQKPDVVSGPFSMIQYDRDHYIQLAANKNYFKGAPKIDQLNFNVMQGSQIYARLQSGEIDFNTPNLGVIPVEDFENVKALPNMKTNLEEPIANQFMYINETVFPDAKQRKALVHAINREQIVNDLLKGNGEVIDGFFTSYSPYFDETLGVTGYDPEKAKSLLEESGWDFNREIVFSVSSGDDTMSQAANIIAANLNAIGVKVKIKMTDLTTLMDELYATNFELAMLQYSFTPVDPYPDITYLIRSGNINGYSNAEVDRLFDEVRSVDDSAKVKELYAGVNKIAQEEVPMFSVYATRGLSAVSDRVSGIEPRQFGTFINVQDWDVVA